MIELKKEGDIYIMTMKAGENRFNGDTLAGINKALDEVEKSSGAAALVTTGEGKFFSNGLDLMWIMAQGPKGALFVEDVVKLFARIMTFPVATVAAVNGHAFAGGAMLATAHDFRVMRADRGYYCVPEIDLKLPLTPGMTALLMARLPKLIAHEAIVTGRRWSAEECLKAGIVDEVAAEADVLPRAIARVAPLAAKHRPTMTALKKGMYEKALAVMNGPQR